jgi:AcrR family transcriptional regulator
VKRRGQGPRASVAPSGAAPIVDAVNIGWEIQDLPKKQYHHGDLRDSLVREAIASLEASGELPSWRALARACGVSQSAPYRHFDGLDELRSAVAAEGFRRLGSRLRAATRKHTDPLEAFEAGFRAYVRFGAKHGSLYGIMFEQGPSSPEVAAASAEAYSTLLTALAALGIRDPLRVAFVVVTAHHGLVDFVRRGFEIGGVPTGADALAEVVLPMLRAYIADELARQAR